MTSTSPAQRAQLAGHDNVIDDDTIEASFAVCPLRASCIRREALDLDRNTNRTVLLPTEKDETDDWPLMYVCPLKSNVLCLERPEHSEEVHVGCK